MSYEVYLKQRLIHSLQYITDHEHRLSRATKKDITHLIEDILQPAAFPDSVENYQKLAEIVIVMLKTKKIPVSKANLEPLKALLLDCIQAHVKSEIPAFRTLPTAEFESWYHEACAVIDAAPAYRPGK